MISENILPNRNFSWYDIVEPREEDFETLAQKVHLPYLLIQDTLRPEHLPKYESTDEGHFLMMRSYDQESDKEATTVQELTRKIAIYISEDKVISIHRVQLDYMLKLADRYKKSEPPKSLQGLVHQIVLGVIRTYEGPVNTLQDLYDQFEEDVLQRSDRMDTARIYHFRRKLFVLKRILKQTNDALYRSREFWEEQESMLQDLKENIDQVYFQLDEISDNFEHLFELHISLVEQRANEIVKYLTVFSSVLLPLNFIASFYGMNFEFLPGLRSETAFAFICLFMIFVSVSAIWFFRRKGWFNTPRQ